MITPRENIGFYAAILFLIWPLLALLSAFKNYNHSWGKNILWAFVAFYGFSFAIGVENQESDIVRYVAEVKYLHGVEMTFADAYNYFLQSGEVDIVRTIIALALSRFTGSQAALTLIYGIIFGFFFSRNMWFVLDRFKGSIKPITIILFICFFLVIPIWDLNGFRFWTASHVFIYGLLPYLFDENKKGLFICSAAILVHYTFVVPVVILIIYSLMGNRLALYFSIFLATFFVSEINLDVFNNFVENYAPEIVQERSASYRSETQVESFREEPRENLNWYVIWFDRALKWSVAGFLVLLFFNCRQYISEKKGWLNLYSFILLFYGIANLFNSLPSGGRFLAIANLASLALISLYVQNREQDMILNRFVWASLPALFLFIVVAFRTGLYSMSATTVLGNPITALILTGEHISLNDILKMLL